VPHVDTTDGPVEHAVVSGQGEPARRAVTPFPGSRRNTMRRSPGWARRPNAAPWHGGNQRTTAVNKAPQSVSLTQWLVFVTPGPDRALANGSFVPPAREQSENGAAGGPKIVNFFALITDRDEQRPPEAKQPAAELLPVLYAELRRLAATLTVTASMRSTPLSIAGPRPTADLRIPHRAARR
jgi:hypothetical protein